jgi:hypothetical protein
MILFVDHDMLVSGPDLATCERHARLFFAKSQLVHYDSVEIDRQHSANGTDPRFDELLRGAIVENRRILRDLLAKLQDEGCATLEDVLELPQGFKSKLLHTISHLLDGFFGIDSRFFDIDEMSHWLTEERQRLLAEHPEQCWLLRVKAQLVYGQGFEKKSD